MADQNKPGTSVFFGNDKGGWPTSLSAGEQVTLKKVNPETYPGEVDNQFRFKGNHWRVVYNGKDVVITDMDGMHYISHLLHHPFKRYTARELLSIRGKIKGPVDKQMDPRELKDEGLGGGAGN